MIRSTLYAMVLAFAASGCKKADHEAEPPAPQPIRDLEAARSRQACAQYVDQVCDCALKIAELTSECQMAPARSDALDKNLRAALAEGDTVSVRDRRALQANARKIAQACIEDGAKLVKRGCPAPQAKAKAEAPEPTPAE